MCVYVWMGLCDCCNHVYGGNQLGEEVGKALVDALKENSTVLQVNVGEQGKDAVQVQGPMSMAMDTRIGREEW